MLPSVEQFKENGKNKEKVILHSYFLAKMKRLAVLEINVRAVLDIFLKFFCFCSGCFRGKYPGILEVTVRVKS